MKRRYWILAAILLALLSGPACALGGLLEQVGWGQSPDESAQAEPTLYPTVTPTPTRPSPTRPASTADEGDFRLEMTEADLSELIGDMGIDEEGIRIQDMRVRITEQNVLGAFLLSHDGTGLSGEIAVKAEPQVVDGKLYLEIVDYELGEGFSGFARTVARNAIQSTINSINAAHGVPIPIGGVAEITSIELYEGLLVINGKLD